MRNKILLIIILVTFLSIGGNSLLVRATTNGSTVEVIEENETLDEGEPIVPTPAETPSEETPEISTEIPPITLEPSVTPSPSIESESEVETDPTLTPEIKAETSIATTTATTAGKWIQVSDGRWWYRHDDGSYTKNNREKIGGKWYFFDSEGWMKTGWITWKSNWYYLSSSGAMVTGWKKINYNGKGEWFYFFNSGEMLNYNYTEKFGSATRIWHVKSTGVWQYTTSLIDWNLVDSGKHLDYKNKGSYASSITTAVSTWNGYKSGIIRKDTATTINDLTITDFAADSKTAGRTSSAGTMKLNTTVMSTFSSSQKSNVVIHEFGHALGLGHNDSNDVMYAYTNGVTSLTTSDKKSYDAAYKRY